MGYLLGIDLSTTGAKALVIDEKGVVVSEQTAPYPLSTPQPLWSEQNPRDWWSAVVQSVRMAIAEKGVRKNLVGISLSGQMHGLVCLDKEHHVLRPAILWNDQRTAEECGDIIRLLGAAELGRLTGNAALTGFTAPKLLWLKKHEPDCFSKIAHVLLPKDYIRFRLSGVLATDLSDASGTLLLDVENRTWSQTVLSALEIPPEWLPKLFEGPEESARVSSEGAEACGLPKDVVIAAGSGDQAAQAVGVGAIRPGRIALTLGTSGVVFAPLSEYHYDTSGIIHSFCHAVPSTWNLMGVMLSAAGSLGWLRDSLFPSDTFESLVQTAGEAPAGSSGLFFLPYLNGERAPHADPLARGAFIGLTSRHGKAEIVRAVMEGVAFGLRDCFELLGTCLPDPSFEEVRISGGGSKSSLWLQILADVLDHPLSTVSTSEGSAFGAALLAGTCAGVWSNAEEASSSCVRLKKRITPGSSSTHYRERYELFKEFYPLLSEVYPKI